MKDKIKKQKGKLIFRVSLILFCVWLVLSAVYSAVVLNMRADEFINEATKNCSSLYQSLNGIHSSDYGYTVYRYIDWGRTSFYDNDFTGKSYKNDLRYYDNNIRITAEIQDSETSKILDTNDYIIQTFAYLDEYYETRTYEDGFLFFEDFISSMTTEQYEEIKDYLRIKPDKNGNYYELLCTEYYCDEDNRVFIPKTVEIVLTNENNTWYAQDTVIETYPLTPKDTKGFELRKLARDARNVIPDQFVTGDFISDINSDSTDASDNDFYGTVTDVQVEFPFRYTYSCVCNTEGYYLDIPKPEVTDDGYVVLPNGQKYTITPEGHVYISNDDSQELQTIERNDVFLRTHYTERSDILVESLPLLLAGYGIIFLFLLVIGTILCLSLWAIIKTQAMEEQKRREVTNALAHDIKTPLFIIEGYAQNLKENLHTDKREHYADRIMEHTRECNRLVHQMLSFSSLDASDFTLRKEQVNIETLLQEVISDFSQFADVSRISLSAKEACVVSADRELLKRALANLTDNALKHSDEGTEIKVIITEKSISISNVCSAITEEDIKHIKEPFYRAEKNRNSEGSGLGLSIVESVAKHHGFTFSTNLKNNVIIATLTFAK